mgnify:FL=1
MSLPTTNSRVNLEPLHPRFRARLERFFLDPRIAGNVAIHSACRTYNHQKQLYDNYVAGRGNLAANPDRRFGSNGWWKGSYHQEQDDGFCYAVDLARTNRKLKTGMINDIAASYGIVATIRHKEWWHHQPRNAQDWFITPEPPIQIDWAGIIQYVKDLGYRVALSPLRKGSHGEEVRAAQQRLNGLGFNVGVVDGRFGRKTKRGVKGFQRAMPPLVVDGVIGGKTWQRMWESNRP